MATYRTGKTLTEDLGKALKWCESVLKTGAPVWCVRRRETGLIVTYISGTVEEVATWLSFDGEPLDSFTLTPMERDPVTGVRFATEKDWKGGLHP